MSHRRHQFNRRGFLWLAGGAAVSLGACRQRAMSNDATSGDYQADGGRCDPTHSDVLGPFYEAGAPSRMKIAGDDEPGQRLLIGGLVRGQDCATPLAGAQLDIWQADISGSYHGASEDSYRLRGALQADALGAYEFETVMPGHYELDAGPRPAHIHFQVTKLGQRTLTTQLYFDGDPFLAPADACGSGCDSSDPERIIALEHRSGESVLHGTFDIVLAGS